MARKDISDKQVCQAYIDAWQTDCWAYELLAVRTGEAEKVCFRACERAFDRRLISFGVSLRSGWITKAGKALLVK